MSFDIDTPEDLEALRATFEAGCERRPAGLAAAPKRCVGRQAVAGRDAVNAVSARAQL